MGSETNRPLSVGKAIVGEFKASNVSFMAASIAYQAFISLVPLVVLVFFLVSVVGDEGLAATVADTTEGVLPESGTALLEDAIAGSVATTGGSVIGLVTLLWGSLKIFRGLDTAFSEIYNTSEENSFVEQLGDALVVFVALVLALVAAAVATVVFAVAPSLPFIGIVNPLLLVVGFTVAFLPMYYVFPDVDLTVRGVLPGVIVAAVGWAALQGLFQVYVSFSAESNAAGGIGAFILLLTWLYFGGLVLLIGGVVNAIISGHASTAVQRDDDRSGGGAPDQDAFERSDRRIERLQQERAALEAELADLEAERSALADDLSTTRTRRRRAEARVETLEQRTDSLETELDALGRENDRLRRRLGRGRTLDVGHLLRTVLDHVAELNVFVVRESRE